MLCVLFRWRWVGWFDIHCPMQECCVCGKELPNRYSVAGRCGDSPCDRVFCATHWRRGNRRCPAHGYVETVKPPEGDPPMKEQKPDREEAEGKAPEPGQAPGPVPDQKTKVARFKAAMVEGLRLARKLGAGAAELIKKLRKDRSPEAMMATLESQLAANKTRREGVATEVEKLYQEIATKKKAYATAPKAKQRVLEVELKSLLSTYKTAERQLTILLENEKNLALVKGRLNEVMAYGMAGVSETMIDDVIDEVEDKVADAEDIDAASRDLEKAGARRDRESDKETLWEQLGDFDTDQPAASKDVAPDFEVEEKEEEGGRGSTGGVSAERNGRVEER